MPPSRRRSAFPIYRLVRAGVAVSLLVALVAGLAFCAAILLIDPNGYKPDLEAAVKQATGRDLFLRGPMRLGFGLPPWLIAEDVTLSNPPGASRQQMATLERAEARIALWPLLFGNFDLDDVTLIRPDLMLERDASGHGNWLFLPPGPDLSAQPAAPVPSGDQNPAPPTSALAMGRPVRTRVSVQSIHIEEGRIGWRATPDAPTAEVLIPKLDASASGPGGTLLLNGALSSSGRTLQLNGEVGSLTRLFDRAGTVPWPVRLVLQDPRARLAISGGIAQPSVGKGLQLLIEAEVSDFLGLTGFLPPSWQPPRNLNAAIHWGDGKIGSDVGLTGLAVHLDGLRLPHLLPGVDISHADVEAPSLERPLHADIEGSSQSIGDLRLVVNVALLGALLPGAHAADPVPVEITLDAGRALISAKGVAQDAVNLKGADLEVFVRLPDVAAFGPVIGRKLPPLQQLAFEGQIFGDLVANGAIGLRKATLTLPEGQASGDVDIRLGLRPSFHAALTSQHIDLDTLFADLTATPSPPDPTAPAPATPAPAAEPPVAPPSAAAAAAAEPPHWLISDTPIDYGFLDHFDLALQLKVEQLQLGGNSYGQITAAATLRDGKLVVDQLSGMMPGGAAEARLSLDPHAPDKPASLFLRAPSLQLAQLTALFGDHITATGALSTDLDLQGSGRSPHAFAASVDGHLGLASVDSEIDNRVLLALLKLAKLPEIPLSSAGTTKLRCFALRLDASKGVTTVGALVVDLSRMVVTGGGSLDFGQELLALQLRPLVRLGGAAASGIALPVHVGGSFLDPKVTSDVGGKGGPAAAVGNPADPCNPGLAAVAAAAAASAKPKPSAAPAPAPAAATPAAGGTPSPFDVLKDLLK